MRLMTVVIASGLLAGCGSLGTETQEPAPSAEVDSTEPPPSVQVEITQPPSEAESLLRYYQHAKGLAGAELGREHDMARQAYARTRSDFTRMRLAMMLSLPGVPFGDEARALELLEPIAKNPYGRLNGLAQLLISQLQERKRLDANAQGLQQKLDALRSLERNLIERKR
jgi:hypothetical protein